MYNHIRALMHTRSPLSEDLCRQDDRICSRGFDHSNFGLYGTSQPIESIEYFKISETLIGTLNNSWSIDKRTLLSSDKHRVSTVEYFFRLDTRVFLFRLDTRVSKVPNSILEFSDSVIELLDSILEFSNYSIEFSVSILELKLMDLGIVTIVTILRY